MGTLVAWVLVRDEFPGKRVRQRAHRPAVRAADDRRRPDAARAVRARAARSASHLAFTRGVVVVALLFVTLPFVVRSVQPVLLELDREVEEAAASLGASNADHLPPDRPARAAPGDPVRRGARLRPRGGRDRLAGAHHRQGPDRLDRHLRRRRVSDAPQAAASLSLVLIVVSLIVLALIRRLGGRVAH